MRSGSAPKGGERYRPIECFQTAAAPHRQRQQVHIGQLPRAVDARKINPSLVNERQFLRPEFVRRGACRPNCASAA